MKQKSWFCVAGLALIAFAASRARPGDAEEWAEEAKPNEHHEVLGKLVGKWRIKVRLGGEEMEGTSEFRSVLGGRFVVEETRAVGATAWEWIGIHGYDKRAGKHVVSFADNMDTTIQAMAGSCDEKGTTISYETDSVNPGTGDKGKVRWIVKLVSDGRFAVELHQRYGAAKESKEMEIEGTRAR
jgi:hypothetical protein